MTGAPSGYHIEMAMSAWQSARARLLADDADLAHDEAALTALLGHEEGDVREILGRLLHATQHASAMADAADAMLDHLKARRDRYRAREQAMRGTMFAILEAMDERRFELPHGTLSIKAGTSSVVITDEAALSDRFVEVVTTRKPLKAEIKTALNDGEVVDGAMMSNGFPTLTVRSK